MIDQQIRTLTQARADATSISEVARQAGVPYATLHAFLSGGSIRSDGLAKLAAWLGVTLRVRRLRRAPVASQNPE